jgi:ribosomal protein S18 acetylase RimI-like enzyme
VVNILIRDMKKDDLKAVSDLICACYEWLAKMEGFTSVETSDLIRERGSPEAIAGQWREYQFMVAEIDGEAAGAVSIRGNEITRLYVKPAFFRRGLGSRLFINAEKIIADRGYDNISPGAFPTSAPFYEAMGMKLEYEKIAAGGPIKGHPILVYGKKVRGIM